MTSATSAASEQPLRSGLDLEHVDAGVRIQDDLFGHVNGAWLDSHVMPADRSSDGAFHALRDLSEERVREIIEEAAADTDAPADSEHGRIGALYRMFMDTEAIERAGAAPLEPLLEQITAAADLEQVVRTMKLLGAHTLDELEPKHVTQLQRLVPRERKGAEQLSH